MTEATKIWSIRLESKGREEAKKYLSRESIESILRQIRRGEIAVSRKGVEIKRVYTEPENVYTPEESVYTDCDNCPYINDLDMSKFEEVCDYKGIDRQKAREEAKKELRPLKDMAKDIKAVEDEIERLMTVATKMTPNYDVSPISGTPRNKIEDAIEKIEDYRGRLSKLLLRNLDKKDKCLRKVERIEPQSLQKILIYYYFQDMTMEKTAEAIDKSYQWTYEMFKTALDKYSEIS